jgi:2-haloalkanoic acid dehalogenase type II
MIKVIAFDVFGTVVDMSNVPREELRAYGEHIRKPDWSPLVLPESWKTLPAFPDSAEGIARLKEYFIVVTCANGPLRLLRAIADLNGIEWDAIIPLEANRVFKPDPRAYLTVCEVLGVDPSEVMMVTANVPGLGDLEVAASLGMTPQAIRQRSGPKTIIELAEGMGC